MTPLESVSAELAKDPHLWWGYTAEDGWVVLDRRDKRNDGDTRHLLRCRDGSSFEASRTEFGSKRFVWFKNHIAALPTEQAKAAACEELLSLRREFTEWERRKPLPPEPAARNPLIPDLAAPLPGEADLLAVVAADLRDDKAKLVYADWLEEQDDPRGEFLRKFVKAARGSPRDPLPSSRAFPEAWRDLVGITLIEEIPDFRLSRWKDELLALARPAVTITTARVEEGSNLPVGSSKFGGFPDLSGETAWPLRENQPFGFLAQINLADVAITVACRDLPSSGLLSFFGMAKVASDPAQGDNSSWRLIYTPDLAGLRRGVPPSPLGGYDPVFDYRWKDYYPECRLRFAEVLDLPDCYSKRFQETGIDFGHRWEDYYTLRTRLRDSQHHLFGYTRSPTLGYDPLPGPDWLHLCSLGRDDNVGWGWADDDSLYWFITRADLQARRFDNFRIGGG
jgi:uncharacterized protein (TIGR02996 family)